MRGHGDLSQLEVSEIATPEITSSDQVRLNLKAAAFNHLDLFTLQGMPRHLVEKIARKYVGVDIDQHYILAMNLRCSLSLGEEQVKWAMIEGFD